jgi:hypothetical protein
MVPRMADHPIPKLAEAVGDSTPSGLNIEENEATGLGKSAHEGWPAFENEPARTLAGQNPEQWERNER